jgi:hypothetical protein
MSERKQGREGRGRARQSGETGRLPASAVVGCLQRLYAYQRGKYSEAIESLEAASKSSKAGRVRRRCRCSFACIC